MDSRADDDPHSSAAATDGTRRSRQQRKSPWLGVVLLSIFTALGVLGTVVVAIDWLQGLATWSWRETRCIIETSEVVARPELGDHLFQVGYTFERGFERGGRRHSGSVYRHGYGGSDREAEARVLASRYQPGDEVPCWVDPQDPDRSALLRADLWRGLWIFVPLLFVFTGGGALWLALTGWPEMPTKKPKKLAAKTAGRFKTAALPTVLFGVFFLAGTGMLVPLFVWPALRVLEARTWAETPCEILESGVASSASDDGTTYSVQVLFRYTWEGRELLSDRYRFLGGSSSGYDSKAAVVEKIPPGTRTTCFVNPERPDEAVLDRGISGDFLFGLIPLLFALIGAGGLGFTIAAARAARRAAARPSWRPPPVEAGRPPEAGPVTLEPRSGPVGRLLGVIAIALLWNGFVSLFVWVVAREWRAGNPDWFAALVLTPFVVIGLAIASGIPYSLLALLNPRPSLRLSRGTLSVGESAQVEWRVRGLPGRIRKLTLRLVGGPRRVGAEEDPSVVSIVIAERERKQGVAHGVASFTVPEGAHPTSRGLGGYAWKLMLQGEIDRWPDMVEQYEIEVVGRREGR